jgi:membrane protease YdiL (CAAX protease family)
VLPDVSPSILELVTSEVTLAVVGILTAILVGKVIERRSLAEVGLGRRGLLTNTLQGFGIATATILLLFLLLIPVVLLGLMPGAADGATNDDLSLLLQALEQAGGVLGYLGLTFVFACFTAVYEEMVFRGLFFRIVEEELGSWLALAISSLVFGIAHLGNPLHQSLASVAPQIALGLALAAAYVLTRKLWMSIGIHWAWNFVLLALSGGLLTFSDASSGAGTSNLSDTASLIVSIPELVVAVVLLALAIRRSQTRTPRWMQRKRTHEKPYIDENAALLTEEQGVDERAAL